MHQAKRVQELLDAGYNCAEAMAGAFAATIGVTEEACTQAMTGFGGGIGRTGNTCGLVSGAVFALGRGLDRTDLDHAAVKERVYAAVVELVERVEASHGSVLCPGILGVDLRIPEEQKRVAEERLFAVNCRAAADEIAAIVAELLAGPTSTS